MEFLMYCLHVVEEKLHGMRVMLFYASFAVSRVILRRFGNVCCGETYCRLRLRVSALYSKRVFLAIWRLTTSFGSVIWIRAFLLF